MILFSKKDDAAGSDGKVSSPNFDTIICVLFSRKRSSLVDAPTGESGGGVVVSTKTPRFCPWWFASPDRAASARTTTQTDRKDRIISLKARCSLGKNEWCRRAFPLSLSLSLRHHQKRPTKETTRAQKATKRRRRFFCVVLLALYYVCGLSREEENDFCSFLSRQKVKISLSFWRRFLSEQKTKKKRTTT